MTKHASRAPLRARETQGMLPRWLPSGQSGVAPGCSWWQEALFTYQHYDHS